ncbi:MAG: ATP synthase F1 subunit delta [Alphaproteobacteria bacterium]|nr:ATP synthase F1 subunit delta [Alphaproteobacteria bacterium]OJV45509.1 MAG: ATP synthase F1 subunit delta [Alphaproteobacteria bacterium 43-37]
MSQIADRYAKALFVLAEKAKKLDAVRADLLSVGVLMHESEVFRNFIFSKRFGKPVQVSTLIALANKLKLSPLTQKFLGLLCQQGRLGQLQPIVTSFDQKVAAHKGETYVDVESAVQLTAGEEKELVAGLTSALGKKVILRTKVNVNILGGLKVRFGSKLIDGSYQTKLSQLHLAMKGV